jgi:hypothetical protein
MVGNTAAGFQVFSLQDSTLKVQTYKKRQFTHKTKSGCLTCRAKRVKVSESVNSDASFKGAMVIILDSSGEISVHLSPFPRIR